MNAVQKTILEPTIVVVVKPSGRVDDWVLKKSSYIVLSLMSTGSDFARLT